MPRPRVYRAEGIVLRQQRLGEADRILTIFTPRYGKIRAVGKGVRRTRSRMGGHLEPLTRVDLLLAQGKSLDVISQSQTVDPYLPLRDDLWRMACALYLAELVDRFTEEAVQVETAAVFGLLAGALHWLTLASSGDLVMRHFELQLLDLSGFRPQLIDCPRCGRGLGPEDRNFVPAEGGIVCRGCVAAAMAGLAGAAIGRELSLAAVKVLRFLLGATMLEAERLALEGEVQAELEAVMGDYVRAVLEREVNTRRFVNTLRPRDRTP